MKEKLCVSVRGWFSDMKEWEKKSDQEQQTIKQVQDIVLLFDSFLSPFFLFLLTAIQRERERERENSCLVMEQEAQEKKITQRE